MGSGNYVVGSWKEEEKNRSVDQIAEDILEEFEQGFGIMEIKPGIIGEIGISDIENPIELKGLRGAGKAQKTIGCAITVHPTIWDKIGHTVLDILEEEEVEPSRVILSHCDPKMNDFEHLDSLAKRGAYIEFDEFGMFHKNPKSDNDKMIPSDNERITNIVKHIEAGNVDRLLISHDICTKLQLSHYGGHGFGHILKNIVPWLLDSGITMDQIKTILIENPKNILSY
jgi:phosphotriesterase-related protein